LTPLKYEKKLEGVVIFIGGMMCLLVDDKLISDDYP